MDPLTNSIRERLESEEEQENGDFFLPLPRPSPEAEQAPTPNERLNLKSSILHRAPVEIVSKILGLLPQRNLVVLRNTCRRFYYDYEETSDLRVRVPEWFGFICLLGRDKDGMLACASCKLLHAESEFYDLDIPKPASARRCKETKPLLQASPYVCMSFRQAQRAKVRTEEKHVGLLSPLETCNVFCYLNQSSPSEKVEDQGLVI